MTTKAAAIYKFLNGFGIPAYTATSVPEEASFPYLTYELVIGDFYQGEVAMLVNLWYYTDSEAEPNAKADQIGKVIGLGGKTIHCDDGLIWIKRGTPWCQSVTDEDNMVKRRYMNFDIEFLTID